MSSTFFIPAVNIMGIGCLDEAMSAIRNYGFRKALIVTDTGLAKAGVASMVAEKLAKWTPAHVVLDPVMVAKSGDLLLERDAVGAMREALLPQATLLTPNLPEAGVLLEERPVET
ncbi:bifunctional hydroxymethylpyrimidine kinase/phosphomethylpyrimidine kinase, partial [Cronobacter sakazakii]|uniref:bifunctional hydroxymethylpyrimidine kinase/phosphomethylpyrimidine kinase n=1 Tax=Cronobacter sakazakii TaxID=28141 RepID=UPI00191C891A